MIEQKNKDELRKKVLKQFESFQESLFKEGGKLDCLLNSGVFDFSEQDNGHTTSSIINAALGKELTQQHSKHLSKSEKEDVECLFGFL